MDYILPPILKNFLDYFNKTRSTPNSLENF